MKQPQCIYGVGAPGPQKSEVSPQNPGTPTDKQGFMNTGSALFRWQPISPFLAMDNSSKKGTVPHSPPPPGNGETKYGRYDHLMFGIPHPQKKTATNGKMGWGQITVTRTLCTRIQLTVLRASPRTHVTMMSVSCQIEHILKKQSVQAAREA